MIYRPLVQQYQQAIMTEDDVPLGLIAKSAVMNI